MPSPTIDGHAAGNNSAGAASTVSCVLTTTNANDLIYAFAMDDVLAGFTSPSVVSVAGGGLTWTLRKNGIQLNVNGLDLVAAIYTAPAVSAVTSQTITATFGGSSFYHQCIICFGVSGILNINDPFDGDPSTPAEANSATSVPNSTISTAFPDDLLLAFSAYPDSGSPATPSGWTTIDHTTDANGNLAFGGMTCWYKSVSATQSSLSVATPGRGVGFVDAVTGDNKRPVRFQTFVS